MAINLNSPLRWNSATSEEQRFLKALQANILKGHGRSDTWNIFFQFGPDQPASKRAVRELGNYHVSDAYTQLRETEVFKATGKPGETVVCAFLSFTGYKALGLTFPDSADNAAFKKGMKDPTVINDLADPIPNNWEPQFNKQIDGLILVGESDLARGEERASEIITLLVQAGATIHHVQRGKVLENKAGKGIEHFGYVDGRSQPLLLAEQLDHEAREEDGTAHWNPSVGLNAALVLDPFVGPPNANTPAENIAFGSFFVFRKLEQDVRAFKTKEQALATALGLTLEDRERAGALAVGRFEDGTPVTMSDEARGPIPPNDFDYTGDAGARCPFHAHIRKTNPRGSGGFAQPEPTEKAHLMPRRGIPYEDVPRGVHPSDLPEALTVSEFETKVKGLLPTGGVGLLFMAYNSKLTNQFVFTQKSWANSLGFPQTPTPPGPAGLDPIIGQDPGSPAPQQWPKQYDNLAAGFQPFDFSGFVKMKGGEFFFAPSLTFLRSV